MIWRETTEADIRHVVTHMRDSDRREVYACQSSDDPELLIENLVAAMPLRVACHTLCTDDGVAVALIGVWHQRPGLGQALMIATDRWKHIAKAGHAHALWYFISRIFPTLRRVECRAFIGHSVSRGWLKRLGFVEEGHHPLYGQNGETFVTYAWLNPKYLHSEITW